LKDDKSWQEGYEAGLDAGRAEQQADMESLYAMYKQACAQRDMLMDQQRAQVAAMRGQIQ
jgi:flagellar biosynthesis/type III secretory pathway protein FliH